MKLVRSAGIILFCGALSSAHALSIVTQRSQIAGTDTLTWDQFGPSLTTVPNPSVGTTTSGSQFAVSSAGLMVRADEGTTWHGNFSVGQKVLYSTDKLTIDFAETYASFGLQIQADSHVPFTATISAYDGLGQLLGTFTENGTSNGNNDGSAIFLGVTNGVNDIAEVDYSVSTTAGSKDFAVNYATIQACPTPEPSTILAMAPAAAGLLSLRRRRKA